jgi:Ni,Fe-hydrogenase III large subunit/Ni,Fe-hydrogenase III component G
MNIKNDKHVEITWRDALTTEWVNRISRRLEEKYRFVGMVGEFFQNEPIVRVVLAQDGKHSYEVLTLRLTGTPPAYPSLSGVSPAAIAFEREIGDLMGFSVSDQEAHPPLVFQESRPEGAYPLDPNFPSDGELKLKPVQRQTPLIEAQGEFQFTVGPVRSGTEEAQQFVFNTVGEEMLYLDVRLYYKHRGLEKAFQNKSPMMAIPLAERISGRSSFAHSLAFCQAIESILDIRPPMRALYLRTLYAELERLHSHFQDLGDLCESTSLPVLESPWTWLKEQTLRLNTQLGLTRYLRSVNVIGGVTKDLGEDKLDLLQSAISKIASQYRKASRLSQKTYSHVQRLENTGALSDTVARDYGCVGPVARASDVEVDARYDHPYAAYPFLQWRRSGYIGGDAFARMVVRLQEMEESLNMVRQCADWLRMHPGPTIEPHDWNQVRHGGVGLGWAETPRGETVHFVRLNDDGSIARVKFRTPSFMNWQPFPLTIEGIMMPDFAVNKASWNLSVAGNDL